MWFVSPLAVVSSSSCCPSKQLLRRDNFQSYQHALLVTKEEDYVEWFKNAGFKDVKLKRIGPKWYHGGFKVRHGQVHQSVHIRPQRRFIELEAHSCTKDTELDMLWTSHMFTQIENC